jgi:hypothetical protein
MKIRLVILTSFITTVVVLMIVLVTLSVANPIMAQSLPAQAPSLADAHLALPGGGGGGGQVWSVFGSDLEDLYSTSQHSFDLGGCRYYTSAGTNYANATVVIPSGATITWMRFLYVDTLTDSNLNVDLRRYTGRSYDILVNLYSSGSAGEGYTTSAALNIPVDNFSYLYMVHTSNSVVEDDFSICQIQIGYTLPNIFGAALPLLNKE